MLETQGMTKAVKKAFTQGLLHHTHQSCLCRIQLGQFANCLHQPLMRGFLVHHCCRSTQVHAHSHALVHPSFRNNLRLDI